MRSVAAASRSDAAGAVPLPRAPRGAAARPLPHQARDRQAGARARSAAGCAGAHRTARPGADHAAQSDVERIRRVVQSGARAAAGSATRRLGGRRGWRNAERRRSAMGGWGCRGGAGPGASAATLQGAVHRFAGVRGPPRARPRSALARGRRHPGPSARALRGSAWHCAHHVQAFRRP